MFLSRVDVLKTQKKSILRQWVPGVGLCYRFNATKMLELIRGKRLVFVGDSINRNQWESMLCMLMGAIKDPKRVYETHRRRITKEKGDYSIKFMVILQNFFDLLPFYL